MNLRIGRRSISGAALVAAAGMVTGCGGQAEPAEESYTRIMNVGITRVVPQSFTATLRVTASVEAYHDVRVVAEEGGVVDRILPAKGARVREGQALAQLDTEVMAAQLDEARAAADLAEDQWQRQRRLWEEEQVGTEIAYIQARENARMRAATVRTLETRLEKKTIRSPVDGTFEDYFVEEGEFAAPGVPLARVISSERMKIIGGVPERFSTEVRPGTPVEVSLDPYPDQRFPGKIDFVGDAVDTDSRTIPIEVHLDNPGGLMKAGMIASLIIARSQIENALVVPQEAVLRIEQGYQVFVVEQDGSRQVARSRMVELGLSHEDFVVIESGLQAGESIVTVGQLKLGNGDVLNIVSGGDPEGVEREGGAA
jgi:membrane fusion protein (multidrug efflux system)